MDDGLLLGMIFLIIQQDFLDMAIKMLGPEEVQGTQSYVINYTVLHKTVF